MPEMPAVARTVVTSRTYRMFARRVLLSWVIGDEQPAGHHPGAIDRCDVGWA
jgi:hypothetical protein